jgi:hypothetical protein
MHPDQVGASLRSNLLYRYLVLNKNYDVVQVRNYLWMIRKDRLHTLQGLENTVFPSTDEESEDHLNNVFRVANLGMIPASWGRSYSSLSKTFHPVQKIDISHKIEFIPSVKPGENTSRLDGDTSSLLFDIREFNMNGRDAGLVSFSFKCEEAVDLPVVELSWSSMTHPENAATTLNFAGKNGDIIVPLDANPAWLLTDRVQTLGFKLKDKNSCKSFTIDKIVFQQRNAIAKMSGN